MPAVFVFCLTFRKTICIMSVKRNGVMKKMSHSAEKTNAMRIMEQKKAKYVFHDYTASGAVAGEDVAAAIGQSPDRVFKTLVTVGMSGKNYVFVVPVCKELDLKKAAKTVGEKWVEMIKSKELLPLTGYVHGGCSPVGMKKLFRTVIDISAESKETVCFSGGKIGYQMEAPLSELEKVIPIELADITE